MDSDSMDALIEKVYDKIKDFRKDEGVHITPEGIRDWALQFGDDAAFMLAETDNILNQTYLTKEEAIELFRNYIKEHLERYHYPDIVSYLKDVSFLRLQLTGKSQDVIVDMVEEIIWNDYGEKVTDYADCPKKLYVYFDDVLVTGGTLIRDLSKWINSDKRLALLNERKIFLEIDLIVEHRFGLEITRYRLGKYVCPGLNISNINVRHYYEVENHLKLPYAYGNQQLNAVAIPVKDSLSIEAINYWENLKANKHADYAFRPECRPTEEKFFTSPENRTKFEKVLVEKGLYIINQIQNAKENVRPLGFIYSSYKTMGVGTLFFTWRNVPNNAPLVFWWEVAGHNWKPLFHVKKS